MAQLNEETKRMIWIHEQMRKAGNYTFSFYFKMRKRWNTKYLCIMMLAIVTSCTMKKIEGVVVHKSKTMTSQLMFYTLSVKMGEDTIECNVSHAVYDKYNVGDSVHEKYRYLATSAE